MDYIGRFAPSPTGKLHFGSLLAALSSYLDAKKNNGKWFLRIEDIDKKREMKGASENIISTLETFGFEWDGRILYQSQRLEIYQSYLDDLLSLKLIYPCGCSRKEIADSGNPHGIEGAVYLGTCRNGQKKTEKNPSWRIRVDEKPIRYIDKIQGPQEQILSRDIGDFVLKRADNVFSYQLAVTIDDDDQGITNIVRGADLIDSTPRQIFIQNTLGLATPSYAHIPVATNIFGEKLSKQTLAQSLNVDNPTLHLWQAFKFLGQNVDPELTHSDLNTFWQFAIESWEINQVPKSRSMPC